MASLPIARLASFYTLYGPGRLPYADRREIGAGYMMATMVGIASVILLFIELFVLYSGFSLLSSSGLAFFVPFYVSSAFVAGVVTCRWFPYGSQRFGPAGGIAATMVTYLFGSFFFASVTVGYEFFFGTSTSYLSPDSIGGVLGLVLVFTSAYAFLSFISTFWLGLPLGALGGYIYERAQTASTPAR
jgi:hypothetical protein